MKPDLQTISDSIKLDIIRDLVDAFWDKYPQVSAASAAMSLDIIRSILEGKVTRLSPALSTGKLLKSSFDDDHPIWDWVEFIEVKDEDIVFED